MYCGRDFDPTDPGENELFAFDFVNDVAAGETLVSATWTCSVVSGTDTNAGSHLSGAADVSVTKTSQRISGLVAGVKYLLQATVITTQGNTKSLWSHVLCQTPK